MKEKTRIAQIAMFAAVLFSVGCQTALADNVADVRTVATAYSAAVAKRDAATMKSLAAAGSGKVVAAYAGMIQAFSGMDDAAEGRFGQRISPAAEPVKSFASLDLADVKIDGTTAIVTPSDLAAGAVKMILQRETGGWKVDVASGLHNPDKVATMFDTTAVAAKKTTDQITGGAFATAADAKVAYYKAISEEAKKAGLIPANAKGG